MADPRYRGLWVEEAATYVRTEPNKKTPKPVDAHEYDEWWVTNAHLTSAISGMVLYVVQRHAWLFDAEKEQCPTEWHIAPLQLANFKSRVNGADFENDPLCMEDILLRRDQQWYTGETAIAVENLRTDLQTLFRTARARYVATHSTTTPEDFFDADYPATFRQDLKLTSSKFWDFTTICKRFYLDGYESVAADRPAQISADSSTPTASGFTLSRIDSINMLRAELWTEEEGIDALEPLYSTDYGGVRFYEEERVERPLPPLNVAEESLAKAVLSPGWEWRKEVVTAYLRNATEGSGNEAIFANVVEALKEMWNGTDTLITDERRLMRGEEEYDDEANLKSNALPDGMQPSGIHGIKERVVNRMGLHQIKQIFMDAQFDEGLPPEQWQEFPVLSKGWYGEGYNTYDQAADRIKSLGVPPIKYHDAYGRPRYVPRDTQAGMWFYERSANGKVVDEVDLRDGFSRDTPAQFTERMRMREFNDPVAEWVDRNTGELRMNTVLFYKRFRPYPEYFAGGESGQWWQQILRMMRRDGTGLQKTTVKMVRYWLQSGIQVGWFQQPGQEAQPASIVLGADLRPVPVVVDGVEPEPVLPLPAPPPAPPPPPPIPDLPMPEDLLASLPLAVSKPWLRTEPDLYTAPYPSWHPSIAGWDESDANRAFGVIDTPERRYWALVRGWGFGPGLNNSDLFQKILDGKVTNMRVIPNAYTNPRYYDYLKEQ
jgi:hypothetical protein